MLTVMDEAIELGKRKPTFNEIAAAMHRAGIQPLPSHMDLNEPVSSLKVSALIHEINKDEFGEFEVEDGCAEQAT